MAEKNHNPYSTQQRSISGINAFASPDFNVELLNYDRFLETKSGDKRKPVIYGETRTGGILVFQDLVGPNKDYLLQVYTVSEGEIHSVPAVYVNGSDSRNSMFSATVEQIKGVIVKKHPFQKTTIEYDIKYQSFFDTLQVTSGSQRTIYTQVSTGRTDYTTTPLTIAKLSPKWDDTFQGNGSAAVAVLIDLSAFDVEPKIEFNIKGQLVRDIRTESNEKVWSNNPALCLYDYLTNSRYGAGKDPSVFDINSFIEQAAVCDQVINLKTGQNLLANTSAKTTIRESDSTLGGKVINIGPSRFRSRARTDLHRGHIINDGYDVVGLMATNSSAENTQRAQAFNKQIFEQAGYQITDPILLINTLRYKSGGLTSGGDYYGYAIIINANGEYVAALAGNEDVEVTVELAVKNKPVGDVEESARFSFNGIIDQSETVKDNVEKMLSEMNATLPPYNGLTHLKCHVPSTVVKTFDLSNIIGDIEYEFGDSDTKYNGVQATYRDPNFGYTNQSVVTIDNSYDGGDSNSKEFKELNLNFCNSYGRAHYLASMFLNKSKLQDSIKFTSTHVGIQYQVGNIIRVNDTKNNIDRAYSIVDKIINTDSTVTLLCLVYDTGIFEVLQLNIPYDANLPLTTTTITESLDPVTDFTVKQVAFDVAGSADLSWKASAAVDHFNIEYKTTGQYKLLAKTNDLSFRAVSLKSGAYTFRIRACNKLETLVSDYVSATLNINTNVVEFPSVSNVAAEFTSVDAVVKWDDLRNTAFVDDSNPLSVNNSTYRPFISGYEVRVYSGTSLRRTEVVTDPSYRYTLDKNAADGLKRSIKFVVRTINTMNQTGSATATVTVVNSQIAAPIDVVVNVDYDTFYASTFKPIELDYNGTQFHMSKTKGFTPSSSSLVADVRDNTFSKSLSVGKWYCRIGHYDVFDKTGMNFSAEKEVVLTEVTLADIDVDGIIAGINESLQNEAVERARVDIQNAQDALLLVTQEASDRAAAIQAETVARTNAVAKEASDRATAITTAVASETSARNTAITAEATTRANAITAEASARHDALIAEASARGTAISNEAKSRSDADGALSSRVDVISAATGSNAAAITAEATARTNADSALSTRVDSVLAKSNANSASISSEVTARTNADSALSTRVDSVLAKSDANSASITSLTKTVTDNNSATATRIDTVEATALTQAENAETSAKTFATASVNTEKNARITADSALTTRIDTVTATADKNKADIVTVNTALTTKEQALAQSITNVQANVDGVDGKLTTEKTARSTADTALSTRIDTVTSTANKNKADIVTVNTAFATADSALSTRIDTVTATANKNKADIVTVNTSLATKEAALASSINTVQANVDGVDGKLTTEKTARTTADTALSSRIDTVTATANKNKADITTVNTALADANTAFASSLTSMETAVKADATTKADAAKAAALVTAAADAKTKADAALAAAKTDATTKANSAESNAKVAAATDAANKAAQALVDAKAYADTKKTEAATYTNSKYDAAVQLINNKDSAQASALTSMEASVKTYADSIKSGINIFHADYSYIDPLNPPPTQQGGNGTFDWSNASVGTGENSTRGIGAVHLKVDASGTEKFVFLCENASKPNIKIKPNNKWILSAWVYSVGGGVVQLYLRTPLKYYVVARNVPAGVWTRISGVVNLDGDLSTEALVRIDADGSNHELYATDFMVEVAPDATSSVPSIYSPAIGGLISKDEAATYTNSKYDQAVTLINSKDSAQASSLTAMETAVKADSKSKADAAEAAAKLAAAADAKTKADNALIAAKSDATTKANNAESAAKLAAAQDAANKAAQALVDAKKYADDKKTEAATYTNSKYDAAVQLINTKDSAQSSALTSMEASVKTDATNKVNAASEIASSMYNLIPDAGFEKPFKDGLPLGFDSTAGSISTSLITVKSRDASDVWGLDYNGLTGEISQGAPDGTNLGKYREIRSLPISVTAGQRIGFSVYAGVHRCKVSAFIYFFDKDNSIVGNSGFGNNDNEVNGGKNLSNYKRLSSYKDVPDGAVYARGVLRKFNTDQGQESSFVFYVMPQISLWGASQTTPPTWCNTAKVDAAIVGADPAGSADAALTAAKTYSNSKYDQSVELINSKDAAQATLITSLETNITRVSDNSEQQVSDDCIFNSRFTLKNKENRPTGWFATYTNATPNNIGYATNAADGAYLKHPTDSSIGMCSTAFRVRDGVEYIIRIRVKADVAKSNGFYFRMQEYDAELPRGKVAIGNSTSEAVVQQSTRQITSFHENKDITTSWKELTWTYKPTVTAQYASALLMNWDGMGAGNALYIDYVSIEAVVSKDYTNAKYDQAVTLINNKDSAQATALTTMEATVKSYADSIKSGVNIIHADYAYIDPLNPPPLQKGGTGTVDWSNAAVGTGENSTRGIGALHIVSTNGTECYAFLSDSAVGNNNIKIKPNNKWIASAWVYSVTGGQVQIYLRTMKPAYYAVTKVIPAGEWTRISGVLNLTGDLSTECVMRLDADGVGHEAYFTDAMIEVVSNNNSTEPSVYSPPVGGLISKTEAVTYTNSKYDQAVQLVTTTDSAMATRVDGLTTTVGNNTSSVNTLSTSVNGLKAEYTVKVNSVGHVAGIGLSSGPMGSAFIAQADRIVLANSTGGSGVAPFKLVNNVVYLNTAVIQNASITTAHVGQLEASNIKAGAINATHILGDTITGDKIKAGTKISSPIIEGGQVRLLGTNYMEISSATPFGPDSLVKWCGAKLMSGSEPNFAALRKSNATQYVTANGDAYFGGALSAGILKNGLDTTLLTPYTVGSYMNEVGPFSSNGKAKNVVVSYNEHGVSTSSSSPGSSLTQQKLQWQLERSINGGSWVTVSSGTFTGPTTSDYDAETNRYTIMGYCNGSTTFTDNTTTVGTYAYRIKVLAFTRFHATSSVTTQVLSLISTEQ